MHYDDKEEDRGTRRSRREAFAEGRENTGRKSGSRREGSGKAAASKGTGRSRLNAKSNKPNVHAQTERSSSRKSGGAAAYKKGSKKAERF